MKSLFALSLLARPLLAYFTVAHRGLFHDVDDQYTLAENSVQAMLRAFDLGIPAVELDLRLTSDGQTLVVHDVISNRVTTRDNYNGHLDPIDVALNQQPKVAAIPINSQPAAYWSGTPLKTYGRNGNIVNAPDADGRLETLDAMLSHFQNYDTYGQFMLILDIQDPAILKQAAGLVQRHQLEETVYLKFFAKSAIDSSAQKYNGISTCHQYALGNNLIGMKIIPQINDGELTYVNGVGVISVFQTTLTIEQYLDCWAYAQSNYDALGNALTLSMVSASVPASIPAAYQAALSAFAWAGKNGRKKMAIVPNADGGRQTGSSCTLWTYQSNAVSAVSFDTAAQTAKSKFAFTDGKADYVVIDVMGHFQQRNWYTSPSQYNSYLC